jgi:hypothetical protein
MGFSSQGPENQCVVSPAWPPSSCSRVFGDLFYNQKPNPPHAGVRRGSDSPGGLNYLKGVEINADIVSPPIVSVDTNQIKGKNMQKRYEDLMFLKI